SGVVSAKAAQYVVETCRSVSGSGAGPVPVNVSSGRFSAGTACRLGSGGHIGYRLSPDNQGSQQVVRQDEWAALQWNVPGGVEIVRAWTEAGGTSANGSGRGFGADLKPWMFRTLGFGTGGLDLFAARFSIPNDSLWFAPGDAPGAHGWFWGNESGGLGTPAQWNHGEAYSLGSANGYFSSMFLPEWLKVPMGDSGVSPRLRTTVPSGPYNVFRAELRCAAADCRSEGFTYVQVQRLAFTMNDPVPPSAVAANPDPGSPGSIGDQVLRGRWLKDGVLPVLWAGADTGTGLSSARLQVGSVQVGQATELSCPGGRPGQPRTAFKPCGATASGTTGLNLAQVPQGKSQVSACLDDGVSQRTCSAGFTVRHDSVAPAIDAPAMTLRQATGGFRLSLDNPDFALIAGDERAPLSDLTFSVEKRVGGQFEALVPERTVQLGDQGSEAVITAGGITLDGDGVYRVCARLRDAAGNQAAALTCTNLTVDDALPDTRITQAPPLLTADPVAVFAFTSDRPDDATYECRFDSGIWQPCAGGSVERSFEGGEHRFEVRAILPPGTSGNAARVDPTPATHGWTVDTDPPDTTINSSPGPLTRGNASFAFEATEPGSFECSLDQSAWTACTVPATFADLADGMHEFRVRAIDRVGNVDPSPATYEFMVDRTPPVVDVTGSPPPVSEGTDPGFSWTVTDVSATVSRCRLDGGEWSAWGGCRSPWQLEGLEPGAHTVEIQAKDDAGNVSETTVITFYIQGPREPEPPPPPVLPPVRVEVPSRKYCALTDFSIRPTARGLRATLTASRYSRFVRIQFFRDTPAVRRALSAKHYRELPRHSAAGPVLTLKRKAIRDSRRHYRFPAINLRTIPAWYRLRGERLIAIPRVSNEWTRCVIRYRKQLKRPVKDLSHWKKRWGIGTRYG
ncbi:MAG: hypothetical protein M3Y45_02915, partial [Actinomycetota bacterium]|nr:hypothetical protein [Actinomycetota bacterium]